MPRHKTRPPDRCVEISDAEEARIQACIAKDPDNPEWSDEDLALARPASEVLAPALYAALTQTRRRPKAQSTTTAVRLRLDPETVAAFKASGPGWQTRMNEVLGRAAKRLKAGSG